LLRWRWLSQHAFEGICDRLRRLAWLSHKAVKAYIARLRKVRKRTRRVEWSLHFECLCFERVEDRRLLSTVAVWDGSLSGSWVAPQGQTSHWLVNGQPAPWQDGYDAEISGPTGQEVSILIQSQVNPASITCLVGASCLLTGGKIGLTGSTSINVAPTTTLEIDSEIVDATSGVAGQIVTPESGTLIVGNPDNSYSGGTQIAFGSTVQLANNATLGQPTNPLQLIGTLDVNGCGLTVGSLTGGGTVENSSGLVTFTVATDSALDTFSGDITGAIDLQTAGSGVLALAGTESYTGYTYIVSGNTAARYALDARRKTGATLMAMRERGELAERGEHKMSAWDMFVPGPRFEANSGILLPAGSERAPGRL